MPGGLDDKKVHAALTRAAEQLDTAVREQEAGVHRILGLVEQLYAKQPDRASQLKLDAVIEACTFQDTTSQRIGKVSRLIKHLRDHRLVDASDLAPAEAAPLTQSQGLSQDQINRLLAGEKVKLD